MSWVWAGAIGALFLAALIVGFVNRRAIPPIDDDVPRS